jgi:hypothetical protein
MKKTHGRDRQSIRKHAWHCMAKGGFRKAKFPFCDESPAAGSNISRRFLRQNAAWPSHPVQCRHRSQCNFKIVGNFACKRHFDLSYCYCWVTILIFVNLCYCWVTGTSRHHSFDYDQGPGNRHCNLFQLGP